MMTYEEGERVRAERQARPYERQRSPEEYLKWISEHAREFHLTRVHPQDQNREQALCLFTVASQHVWGDSVEECIDNAIEAARARSLGWRPEIRLFDERNPLAR